MELKMTSRSLERQSMKLEGAERGEMAKIQAVSVSINYIRLIEKTVVNSYLLICAA